MNVDENIHNNQIEINDTSLSSNVQNSEAAPIKTIKNTYKSLVNNIKKLTKLKINSSVPENEQQQNNNLSTSDEQIPKEETWKEKISNNIIKTVEIQKNLTIFFSLLGLGSLLLCLSIFILNYFSTLFF